MRPYVDRDVRLAPEMLVHIEGVNGVQFYDHADMVWAYHPGRDVHVTWPKGAAALSVKAAMYNLGFDCDGKLKPIGGV